jgi:hypothetical protein
MNLVQQVVAKLVHAGKISDHKAKATSLVDGAEVIVQESVQMCKHSATSETAIGETTKKVSDSCLCL